MTRETIIERIKKLLSMTTDRGATEAEALQAALMAQKLISENHIEKHELMEKINHQNITQVSTNINTSRNFGKQLASIVARNFRCFAYLDIDNSPVFYGYEMDAEAARLTFEMLYKVGNRLANKAAREQKQRLGTSRGAYNSFAMGFLRGVDDELSVQTQALMLVIPKTVKESFDEFSKGFVSTSRTYMRGHHGYYEDGRSAAKNVISSHRMNGQLGLTA